MAKTIKRRPVEFSTNVKNLTNHFNQMQFKGIIRSDNIFEADQQSLKDALNVYVDEHNTLTSRLPIVYQEIQPGVVSDGEVSYSESIIPPNYILVDMRLIGDITLFVLENNLLLKQVVAMRNADRYIVRTLSSISNYHISTVEQYIIVFNNIGALVLDTDQFLQGWKSIEDYVEIPVTKRVVKSETFTYPNNQFTKSYKEEYVLSPETLSILPDGDAIATVSQSPNNLSWTIPDANINPEFRILKSLNILTTPTDIVTAAVRDNATLIAVARSNYCMLSLDGGETFQRILYPENTAWINIASLSEDGLCFFFVSSAGVHRYTIGSEEWTLIEFRPGDIPVNIVGTGISNYGQFKSAEVFTFATYVTSESEPIINLYWKGENLQAPYPEDTNITIGASSTIGYTEITEIDLDNAADLTWSDMATQSIYQWTEGGVTNIASWLPLPAGQSRLTLLLGKTGDDLDKYEVVLDYIVGAISKITTNGTTATVEAVVYNQSATYWYQATIVITLSTLATTVTQTFNTTVTGTTGLPLNLRSGYLLDLKTYSIDGIAPLPEELTTRRSTYVEGSYFYIVVDNLIYTNKLDPSETILTYTYLSDEAFNQIPAVSHTGNELYLGFGNTLKITANLYDGQTIQFNLPEINNQRFISSVNAVINISTTEIAVFLIDEIFIVTQTADETFGYRYDYHNTRLSTGVRTGDSVINTRDGVYTLYPTRQGLAVMNYQALMATTDQVVDYVTKNIIEIWMAFYNNSKIIRMTQMRDFVYITNDTSEYLMLDLRNMIWWKFGLPITAKCLVTNQETLQLVSNGLYLFDINYTQYRDVHVDLMYNWQYTKIDWSAQSQSLHFNRPNHYKNMKQVIFQFEESTNLEQTIVAQLKLYRKQITIKEPEIVAFTVDGYRTFVKRFNYWKINELQWGLASDDRTTTPARLRLNGLTIKYEQGEEVR